MQKTNGSRLALSAAACALLGACGGNSVQFSVTGIQTSESSKYVDVTVLKTGTGAVSVGYSTADGDAIGGQDYEATTGLLVWAANDTQPKTIRINLLADTLLENPEDFKLSLYSPVGGTLGANKETTINIDDTPCAEALTQDISVNTTLDKYCYHVTTSRIEVNNGATLTLKPGVTLVFSAGSILDIRQDGALSAMGLANDPITLTSEQPIPGYWTGLQFTWSDSVKNQLDHVDIEYGGGTGGNGDANLTLFGGTSLPQRIKMSNTRLRHSAAFGFEFSPGANIDLFDNVTSTENQAPGRLSANVVGSLSPNNHFAGNETDQLFIADQGLTVAQTWNTFDADYYLNQGLKLTAPLTLSPGSTLVFNSDMDLNINQDGALKAVGTASAPIVFTGAEKLPGYWRGVQFTFANSDYNELAHTIIEYGGARNNGIANLTLYGGFGLPQRIKIRDSILRHGSGYGFQFTPGSNIDQFSNVTVVDNALGAGQLEAYQLGALDPESDYTGNAIDRIFVNAGTVSGNTAWPRLNVPYEMRTGMFRLEANLNIAAGVLMYFEEDAALWVAQQGSLTALGTASEPIVFTATEAIPGYWMGIEFAFSNNVSNQLDHIVLDYAGGNYGNGQGALVLYGENSLVCSLKLTNSTIRNSNEFGLWIDNGTVFEGSNNYFSNNALGDVHLD